MGRRQALGPGARVKPGLEHEIRGILCKDDVIGAAPDRNARAAAAQHRAARSSSGQGEQMVAAAVVVVVVVAVVTFV